MPDWGLTTTLNASYEEAVERVTAALAEQGFGILTEIDVQATLKKRLGVAMQRYVILGACNPPLAHRAMEAEPSIGLLLPCNVIVYEGDRPGETVVSLVDPLMMVQMSDNPALPPIAHEARTRLERVLAALA
jgi:uncharacterized protein (DUF302 family)